MYYIYAINATSNLSKSIANTLLVIMVSTLINKIQIIKQQLFLILAKKICNNKILYYKKKN